MRTTIDLNDEIYRRAKQRAAAEGTSLRLLIEKALRMLLAGKRRGEPGYRLRWRLEKGQLQPGVSLEDRDALFDLMNGRS